MEQYDPIRYQIIFSGSFNFQYLSRFFFQRSSWFPHVSPWVLPTIGSWIMAKCRGKSLGSWILARRCRASASGVDSEALQGIMMDLGLETYDDQRSHVVSTNNNGGISWGYTGI
jgi:hypothetical protein